MRSRGRLRFLPPSPIRALGEPHEVQKGHGRTKDDQGTEDDRVPLFPRTLGTRLKPLDESRECEPTEREDREEEQRSQEWRLEQLELLVAEKEPAREQEREHPIRERSVGGREPPANRGVEDPENGADEGGRRKHPKRPPERHHPDAVTRKRDGREGIGPGCDQPHREASAEATHEGSDESSAERGDRCRPGSLARAVTPRAHAHWKLAAPRTLVKLRPRLGLALSACCRRVSNTVFRMGAAPGTELPSRARTVAFRAFVVLFALAALIPGFGLVDLTTPLNPKWHEGYVSEVGYGALAGIILPVGFLAQLRSPERRIAGLQQVAATVPAYIAAGVLGEDDDFLPFAAIVAVAVATTLALHPAPRRFVARGATFRPVLALLALAAAVPLIAYGLEAAANQRDGLPPLAFDSHGPLNSWAALAAAAFSAALVALLTSLGTDGFPIAGSSAGAAAAVWGLTSLAHPNDPGSEGRVWASLAVVWALVFIAAVERERRRDRAERQRSAVRAAHQLRG